MLWQIFKVFASNQAEKIFYIYLGTLTKQKKILNGQLTHILITISLNFFLPLHNISQLWTFKTSLFTKNLLILLTLFFYKFLIAFLTGIFFMKFFSLEIPVYFRYTFLAVLVADSVLYDQEKILRLVCPVFNENEEPIENDLQINIKCGKGFEDISSLFQIFNLLVCYVFARILIFRDWFVKKEIGETLVWVNYDAYDRQFERDVEEKEHNLYNKEFYIMLLKKTLNYCTSPLIITSAFMIIFNAIFPNLKKSEIPFFELIKNYSTHFSSTLEPLIGILIGYQISSLEKNLKKGLMISPKLAFTRGFLRIVVIPFIFIFSIALLKNFSFGLDSQITARFFINSVVSSSSIPLIFCLHLGFGYKEISFFLYYEVFLVLIFAPLMIFTFIF